MLDLSCTRPLGLLRHALPANKLLTEIINLQVACFVSLEVFEKLEDLILSNDEIHSVEGLVELFHSEVEHNWPTEVISFNAFIVDEL